MLRIRNRQTESTSGSIVVVAVAWLSLSAGMLLAGTMATAASAQTAKTAQTAVGADLAPAGWRRDTDLHGFKIDRYRSNSGALTVELMAFPATDKSASAWLSAVLPLMTREDRKAGHKMLIIDDDQMKTEQATGPMNSSMDGVDMATQTMMIQRPGKQNKNILKSVRAIIRPGEPVQFSLLSLGDAKATAAEYQQASKIRFDARMAVNQKAAFLGVEQMAALMAAPLLSPDKPMAYQKQAKKSTTTKRAASDQSLKGETATSRSSGKGEFGAFKTLPGPQVRLTGKMLGRLPAGFRIKAKATNYWTNSSMMATRQLFLTMTENGEFEKGRFSISGGMGGVTGTVHASDKDGSHGSVYGNTNPGGPGTRSVAASNRKGLDRSKYGKYYISGSQITFSYANGKVEKKSFKTDGYSEMVIGGKRYLIKTPTGWQRADGPKASWYRSLNGKYGARVTKIKYGISECGNWLSKFQARLRAKNKLVSTGPIKVFKRESKTHTVATVKHVQRLNSGATVNQELFIKCGRLNSRYVQLTRFTGDTGNSEILKFVRGLF